jgi:hypothetical protein
LQVVEAKWQAEVVAPGEIIRQLDHLTHSLCEIEQKNLIGIYLHGSLAMGCFQPLHSDLDLLVLIKQLPPVERRRALVQQILQSSNAPAPIELSILVRDHYTPWRHPTPFSFHFSEQWRFALAEVPGDGQWHSYSQDNLQNYLLDPDLAGHFTVTRHRGVCLAGAPIASTVPAVPWSDYLDSILRDFTWACERADDNPVYLVLNSCRIWAALVEARVLSKAEGADWALPRLPADLGDIVKTAATLYRGKQPGSAAGPLTGRAARRIAHWVSHYIP